MKVLFVLFALFAATYGATVQTATCYLTPTSTGTGIAGTITFTQNGASVDVTAAITGVSTDGEHGMHLHQYGDLSSTTGASAGAHYDPLATGIHACPPNTNRHMGDMGNWTVTAGAISQTKSLDIITLTGPNSIIGRAVVLHGVADDCTTQPAGGVSPPRWAYCVIGVANPGAGNINAAAAAPVPPVLSAMCVLTPTNAIAQNNVSGTIYFEQTSATSPTRVYGAITGLDGVPHGFHIHEFGDVSNIAGSAAGTHYNPLSSTHGIPPFTKRHIGDMGNIYHYAAGVAYYDYSNDKISLNGDYSVLGHAVIVHAALDDCSGLVGNAGVRWGQCVIGVRNTATIPAALPSGVPTTQDDAACVALYPSTMSPSSTEDSFAAVNSVSAVFVLVAMIVAALF